jgi:hypothetical protein
MDDGAHKRANIVYRASRKVHGASTVAYRPQPRLLRFARNDMCHGCHCEERSDEAISAAKYVTELMPRSTEE